MPACLHVPRALRAVALAGIAALAIGGGAAAADVPGGQAIAIRVDVSDTAHKIMQISERIPAPPGPLRLLFPRWLPGFHGPYGDVTQIAGLRIGAAGQRLAWKRDPADPLAFVVDVPSGASAVDLSYQSLPAPESQPYRAPWSAEALGLQWHSVVLYPAGRPAADIAMQASVKLPAGWRHGSALRRVRQVLGERGLKLARSLVGEYLTVQEMGGFQMCAARLDAELARLWDAPCNSPALTVR